MSNQDGNTKKIGMDLGPVGTEDLDLGLTKVNSKVAGTNCFISVLLRQFIPA